MQRERFAGERVLLRAIDESDVGALQAYLNKPSLAGRRWIPWSIRDVAPLSRKQVEEIVDLWAKEKKATTLGIELRASQELVGHAGWHWGWDTHCPTTWVVVAPDHQRRGIGSDALEILLSYLFEDTPAHNVNGWIASWNEEALAFARKHGFEVSGRVPRGGIRRGAYFDDVMVDILKPEWLARGGGRGA